jgi:hypothetical protein
MTENLYNPRYDGALSHRRCVTCWSIRWRARTPKAGCHAANCRRASPSFSDERWDKIMPRLIEMLGQSDGNRWTGNG